jgi:FkbM family methyltransferase
MLRNELGRLHGLLGRSSSVARFARNVRNQANAIVGVYTSEIEGPNSETNKSRHNEFAIIDRVAPQAANFIDVGANVGWWSSQFISRMTRQPTGLIVEPSTESLKTLHAEFDRYPDVKVIAAAMSDYCGSATLYENTLNSQWSSLAPIHEPRHVIRKDMVPITTLDQEVATLGWDRVSFVKIDAEGEDYFCLRGARSILLDKRVDFIQFECNHTWKGITILAAVKFLQEFGYQTFQQHPEGLRALDVNYWEYGGGNWLAFPDRAPDLGLRIVR